MLTRTVTAVLAATALAAAALAPAASAQESVEWGYHGPTGPEFWGTLSPLFATCGEGSLQSPIDLRGARHAPAERIRTAYTPSPVGQRNNGETIEVRSDLAQTLRVGEKAFSLVQLHFHVPSEHLVAGDGAPLELHFVHQASDGERAVLGVLVRPGRRNAALEQLAAAYPEHAGEETRVAAPVDLTALMAHSPRAYRYAGSLTTPPCSEGIRWMVLARPITVSPAQLSALEEIVEGNARPVQPRNGRPLILH